MYSYQLAQAGSKESDITKLKSYLSDELDQVKSILASYPNLSQSDFADLENSSWYINIFSEDSLIYWNQVDKKTIQVYEKQLGNLDAVLLNLDIPYSVHATTNIYNQDRTIKANILRDLNLNHRLKLPSNLSTNHPDTLSHLESLESRTNRYTGLIRFLIFLISFIGLLYSVYYYSVRIPNDFKAIATHVALSFGILLLLQLGNIEQYFEPLIVFNTIHESSFWVSSLAELIMLNLVVGFCIMHISKRSSKIEIPSKYNPTSYLAVSLILGSSLFYLCHIASGIIRHPNIHLDIDNILLFDKYSLIVIFLLLISTLLTFALSCSLVHMANRGNKNNKVVYYTLGLTLSCIAYFFLDIHIPLWILIVYLITYLLMLDLFIEHRSNSIIWMIWWMVIFASFMAGIVFYNSLLEDIQERKNFVENLYTSSDQDDLKIVSEFHQSVMSSEIFSLLSQLPHGKLQRADLDDYIRTSIPIEILLQDNTLRIECFDTNNETLFTSYGIPYTQIKSALDRSKSLGQYIKYNPYQQTYYLQYFVNNDKLDNAPINLVFIINSNKNNAKSNSIKHNYYVTQRDTIILMEDRNTGELQLEKIASIQSDTIADGYSFVTSEGQDGIRIINYKQISSLIKPISLFSYIFSILGLMIIAIGLLNSKWKFLEEPIDIQLYTRDSLRTKIQLVIIVLVIFSFLIIGLMTGYYFNNLLKNNQSKVNQDQIISVLNSVQSYANTAVDEDGKLRVLEKSLNKITDIHGHDLALYSRSGDLMSFTNIKEDMLRLPSIYSSLRLQTRDIEFRGIPKTIVPLSTNSSQPYAYITITFPESPRSYSSILDFISTILNVYVFLFLIAGAIALAIANSITRPLSVIANKLKAFKLGSSNEPLKYEDNDEIGQLIDEYNNLIVQVQDSADIIAKTERDMAWREMAKQVAHEIKNPLTPMKLSIQYLDKMVKTNPDRAKDITEKVASTLVNQIDALSNIANEFSNYATMPKANNEKIILNEIVEAVHDLFRKRDDMEITMSEPIADLFVFVDRNQLIRILNNLVKNAIQAIPDDRRGKIDISLQRKNHTAIITVKDNGKGIPDFMKQKVFTPNFTTKNSGTGLGLAISANMIDSMNGKIYFETVVDEGTSFYVEIPLVRSEQKTIEKGKRVSLDD